MRKVIPMFLAIAPGCAVISIHEGDGVSVTDVREVGAFDSVSNQISVDVAITYGPTHAAAVTCDQNLVDLIVLSVEGGELTVETEREKGQWVQLSPATDCVVEIVTPELDRLQATGSGDVSVVGDTGFALSEVSVTGSGDVLVYVPVSTGSFDASVTGSGTMELDNLSADVATFDSTGSGGLSVGAGTAGLLTLHDTGSGDILVRGVVAEEVDAKLTGSGNGEVTATLQIEAKTTGSGDLTVWGAPAQRDVDSSGSGEVLFAE